MTVPYCAYFDGSTITGRLGVLTSLSVNNTIVVSSVSGKIRAAWSSGTTADTLSGFARLSHDGLTALGAIDGHVRATGVVATGTGVGPCFVARWSNPGDASCYILKETTPGDPSSWQLYWYSDASPETLAAVGAAITPSGSPTDYTDLNVEYGFVGNSHWIKIWEGTEPTTYTLRTASSEKLTAGEIGAGAWGANGTGDMVEYDTLSFATWNQALVTGRNQQIGDTSLAVTYGGSGDAVPFQFDAPQDVPLWVAVLNSHGSTPSNPESIAATNLVVDGILADEEVNAADAWLTVYKCHASAPITGGYLQATFPAAGGNQTGCCLQVVVVGGAADYVNVGTHPDDTTATTSLTVAPTTFTNAHDTSGTIASEYHGNTNASTIDTTPTHIPGPVSTHATPGVRLTTSWVDANDTSVAFSWTGAVRHCAIAAEIQLADPADHYVETPAPGGISSSPLTSRILEGSVFR